MTAVFIDPWLVLAGVIAALLLMCLAIDTAVYLARQRRDLTEKRIELDERERLLKTREESLSRLWDEYDAKSARRAGRR